MEILYQPHTWFVLGGVVSFIIMIYQFFEGQELSRDGIRVEGTVTDYWTTDHHDEDGMDTTSYYLKAFFTDAEEYVHSVQISVSRKVYKRSVSTMAVKLVHPPEKPQKAKSDQASEIYGGMIIWGVIVLAFAGAYWLF